MRVTMVIILVEKGRWWLLGWNRWLGNGVRARLQVHQIPKSVTVRFLPFFSCLPHSLEELGGSIGSIGSMGCDQWNVPAQISTAAVKIRQYLEVYKLLLSWNTYIQERIQRFCISIQNQFICTLIMSTTLQMASPEPLDIRTKRSRAGPQRPSNIMLLQAKLA
jgi:hypothetical protein